jgi:hypothetical protein
LPTNTSEPRRRSVEEEPSCSHWISRPPKIGTSWSRRATRRRSGVFDRQWAVALLDRAIARLRAETSKAGKDHLFEHLKVYLTGERPGVGYAEVAVRLRMSEGAVKVAVHRLRRHFRTLVQEEIAQTVSSPDEVADEMRHLWTAVSR